MSYSVGFFLTMCFKMRQELFSLLQMYLLRSHFLSFITFLSLSLPSKSLICVTLENRLNLHLCFSVAQSKTVHLRVNGKLCQQGLTGRINHFIRYWPSKERNYQPLQSLDQTGLFACSRSLILGTVTVICLRNFRQRPRISDKESLAL